MQAQRSAGRRCHGQSAQGTASLSRASKAFCKLPGYSRHCLGGQRAGPCGRSLREVVIAFTLVLCATARLGGCGVLLRCMNTLAEERMCGTCASALQGSVRSRQHRRGPSARQGPCVRVRSAIIAIVVSTGSAKGRRCAQIRRPSMAERCVASRIAGVGVAG